GQIVDAWGDPDLTILPRSSCKMVQALPLVESGAAKAFGLTPEQLALACASHNGAAIHTDRVTRWLTDLELDDTALRCGPQVPSDAPARDAMTKADASPCQYHNNCSGKHTGFLTLSKHLGADAEYVLPDHPIQKAALEAFEETTGETSPGHAIDGCSAPNFATSLAGLARAMAQFAGSRTGVRGDAMRQLFEAMVAHPDLVAGEGRACTELMRAMDGAVAVKTGAEGVFTAIIPSLGFGVALKIEDGTARASECAMASILVRLGVLQADHPATLRRRNAEIRNRRDVVTGYMHPSAALL
ncbi:MAG: asparaginase, partial [Pseudomonadota bacterium]